MPEYEFVCLECGKEFSLNLGVLEYEKKGTCCPHCKSKLIEQVVTACVVAPRKS